jgi:hypothetical protein
MIPFRLLSLQVHCVLRRVLGRHEVLLETAQAALAYSHHVVVVAIAVVLPGGGSGGGGGICRSTRRRSIPSFCIVATFRYFARIVPIHLILAIVISSSDFIYSSARRSSGGGGGGGGSGGIVHEQTDAQFGLRS